MTYNIEKTGEGVKISFAVDKKEWEGFADKAYQKQKGRINIPGFRKGHAPKSLIEKMYGKGIFTEDAFDICFRECYSEALDENPEIYPVEEPKINVEKLDGDGATFSAVFAVKPEVESVTYKGLKIPKAEFKVTDTEIAAEALKARARLVRKLEKEGESSLVEGGDTVMLDYSGSVDGVKFEGGTAQNHELIIGSGAFIPGFEVKLLGMKIGESRDITVMFPEEYHAAELAGKEAVFAVTIHKIFANEYPELNDEFAKEVSRFDTFKEYREDIEKRLTDAAVNKEKNENEGRLVDKIVENAVVAIPHAMVQSELDYMLRDLSYRLMYMYNGMKLADYFKHTGGSEQQYRTENAIEAEKNVKTRLVMGKIIKDENITASDEEYDKEVERQAEEAKKTVAEFTKGFEEGQEGYIRNTVLSKKLSAFLWENNEFVVEGEGGKEGGSGKKEAAKGKGKGKKAE
ncbi:MAG: trigger factor [Firmicutes bacterium]|nr:trigger factor [Bacillota bacterium]